MRRIGLIALMVAMCAGCQVAAPPTPTADPRAIMGFGEPGARLPIARPGALGDRALPAARTGGGPSTAVVVPPATKRFVELPFVYPPGIDRTKYLWFIEASPYGDMGWFTISCTNMDARGYVTVVAVPPSSPTSGNRLFFRVKGVPK